MHLPFQLFHLLFTKTSSEMVAVEGAILKEKRLRYAILHNNYSEN